MTARVATVLVCVWLLGCVVPGVAADEQDGKAPWPEHVEQSIEGWTVHVDTRLLGPEKKLGDEVLRILAFKLYEITCRVPEAHVAKLRSVPIWLDFEHELVSMQYHPSKGWLTNHGHDPRMEKSVHIPRARELLTVMRVNKHPWVMLHELAHAFHDRELGFDHPDIERAYQNAKSGGTYENSLLFTGQKVSHYGMTDAKEYFAESTEAFFGVNDFYPFVRAELKEHDPGMYALLEEIWGMNENK